MDLNKLFDLNYLFQRYTFEGFSWPVKIALLIFFVGAIALAVLAYYKKKSSSGPVKKAWSRIILWGWTTGIVGLLMVFFREARTLYLGSRGYLLIFLLAIFIWLVWIIYKSKKEVPDKEAIEKRQNEYEKWLPGRKK